MLNVTAVRPHDDGSENGLYDVELGVADGTRIALEITSLQDETWHRARSALDPWASEFEGASLSRHWIAMAAAEGVRIRGLAAVLEPLLRDVEQAGVDEVNLSSADSISQLPQAAQVAASKLRSMHVHGVISWEEGAFPEGTPRIHVAVSTVAIGHAGVLGSSLSALLADGHNQKKLALARDCDELHLFVDIEDSAGRVLAGGLEPPPCPPDPTGTITWLWAWTPAGDCSGLVFRARPGGAWERFNVHTGEPVPWEFCG